uniref:serine protease HTRA1 isoform X1 n=1 Tax=Monopterus albus TaxID=43700 RepID=UPI0009B4B981|nr:serine protease HTRA1-like isoform X1 [Monopterus albus]
MNMLLLEDNLITASQSREQQEGDCLGVADIPGRTFTVETQDIVVALRQGDSSELILATMKFVACLTLLTSAVYAGLLRKGLTCSQVCDASHCPVPQVCYYGQVKDGCGCCLVCAPGEGEACVEQSGGLSCGHGLRCLSVPGTEGALHSSCVCASSGPVCGSDGRTYPSICRLRAENRRAKLGETAPVFLIQRGRCGLGIQHSESMRYKFNFIADVVDKIAPAVVHLELFQRVSFSSGEVSVSSGSGFVVSEDGWIITSAHVLNNKQRIKVKMRSGLQYDATEKDVDQKMDIALIKIEPDTPLPVLRLGQSSDLRPGEFVVAVGSPFSLQNTITTGIISTAQRNGLELGLKDSDMDYIQTDATINVSETVCCCILSLDSFCSKSIMSKKKNVFCFCDSQYGNSGGPLVNLDGDVIGINTLTVAGGNFFFLSADQFLAESYNRQVNGNVSQKRKYIGIRMLQLSPSLVQDLKERDGEFPDVSSGVYIYEVIPGTAASRAGMIGHDVIIDINGQSIHTTHEVSKVVQSGTVLSVVVRRKDRDVMLTIIPEEMD